MKDRELARTFALRLLPRVFATLFVLGFLMPHGLAAVDSKSLLERLMINRALSGSPYSRAKQHRNEQVPIPAGSRQETYDNWSLTCNKMDAGNVCQIFQIMSDARIPNSKLLLEINSIDESGVKGNLILPPGFMLGHGVTVRIGDSASVIRFPVTACLPEGCVANIAFNQAELALLQESTRLDLAVRIASGQAMHFWFDLRGFRPAFDQMSSVVNP